jgi:hypothetical protein
MRICILLSLIGILANGCVRNNPKPIWLEINQWSIESNPELVTNGQEPEFLSHNFTEAWVYVDNKIIGCFEVPCKIPVLISGDAKKIQIYPAIRNNGIGATKKIYPFMVPVDTTMNLVAGETYSFNPKTKYNSSTKFWTEDFESSTVQIEEDPISSAAISFGNNSQIALSGTYGYVNLTAADPLWAGLTTESVFLPKGKEVYLEVSYRNSTSLLTGVKALNQDGSTTDNPNVAMNAQSASSMQWKKIYIQLTEIVSYSTNANYFKQFLKAQLPEGQSTAEVYIDNIHIVHF